MARHAPNPVIWCCDCYPYKNGFPRATGGLLKYFLLLATSGLLIDRAHAERPALEYRLRLYHTHTKERMDILYRRGDAYVPEALPQLDRFLRDHRTGQAVAQDVH